MGDTNYFSGIVKLLENPTYFLINDKISIITFQAEIPQVRKSQLITLNFWGNLGNDVKKYYKSKDYILIEGYISNRKKKNLNLTQKLSNTVTITVLKVYPFLLKSTEIKI